MITFYPATTTHIPLIRELASQTWKDTYGAILSPQQLDWMFDWMYSPESLHRQIEEEKQQFFIASYAGSPCGYISIERQESDLFHFQKVYVHPAFQGKGVGRALIRQGIEYIRSFNQFPCRIELNVNRQNKALHFYERVGFKIAGQGDFEIGNGYYMNDYIMALSLTR